jgi:hypothetical protein
MKLEVHPKKARSRLPFTAQVIDVQSPPSLTVGKIGETLSFAPRVQSGDGEHRYKVTFWLEEPGEYEVRAISAQETRIEKILVEPQVYMSFAKEFGSFTILFLCVMAGVVLWIRRIMQSQPQ